MLMMTVIDFFVLMLHVQQVNGLCMIEQESTELLFSEIRFFERVCICVCVFYILLAVCSFMHCAILCTRE